MLGMFFVATVPLCVLVYWLCIEEKYCHAVRCQIVGLECLMGFLVIGLVLTDLWLFELGMLRRQSLAFSFGKRKASVKEKSFKSFAFESLLLDFVLEKAFKSFAFESLLLNKVMEKSSPSIFLRKKGSWRSLQYFGLHF